MDYLSEITNDETEDVAQNYNQILTTGSLSDGIRDSITSELSDKYTNLNIDYSKFKNHIFFGSAEQKLKNFKNFILTLEQFLKR